MAQQPGRLDLEQDGKSPAPADRAQAARRAWLRPVLVEDDGPGMDDDDLQRMFTPFERGDAACDPSTGGVGLGLALARGIARAHGGDVWLSRLPTKGLCAHVRLPAAAGRAS